MYFRIRHARGLSTMLVALLLFVVNLQFANAASEQIDRGKLVYDRFCLLCHGKNLEGQKDWRIRMSNGKLPAPPHDETGHTWHHADELLFGIIKKGLIPPYAPPNYKTDMPAWEDTLSDNDIIAVIAYIKSRWPEEQRKIQAEINDEALQRQKK